MTHVLKLNYHFATAVSLGEKNFEIRKNDRGFQKGDYVAFVVVNDDGKPFYDDPQKSCLYNKLFEITYVLNGWGIDKDMVVFGMKRVIPKQADDLGQFWLPLRQKNAFLPDVGIDGSTQEGAEWAIIDMNEKVDTGLYGTVRYE